MNTLADIVERIHARGTETAYIQRNGYRTLRWSYQEVAETARRLSSELHGRGIGPGDTVLLWGDDCAEWVVAFFACILRGAVVVPMDRIASAEFVERVCRQAGARLCVCSRQQPRVDPGPPILTFDDFDDLPSRHSCAPVPVPDLNSGDVAEIVFTSGTTADPKGVVISHGNILANIEPLEREVGKYLKYERLVHPLRFLNLLPLSHVFGQFLGIFIPLILGATVVFQKTFNPSEIIRTIKREKISVLVTVPRVLDSLRDKLERDLEAEWGLERFRKEFAAAENEHFIRRWWRFRRIHRRFGWKFWAFISGGASLGAASEQFWGRLGFAAIQGYGLTETASIVSINHPFKPGKGSIGQVLPGRELKLAPDGEILVRGASIAQSYYQSGEMLPVAGNEGWFHTGDVGALDEKGNLYFKGRRKNVIVSSEGMNIYPEDLETALRLQPEIRDCVVLALERDGNAEPCAVLLLQSRDQNPEAAVQRANASLADFQNIRRWMVWPGEDFPRTSTQKPQIRIIREFADSMISEKEPQRTGDGVIADLISRITGRRAEPVSGKTDPTQDLNLSSIERVELLSVLEDRFQLDLDESRFASVRTIGDMEMMLARPTGQDGHFHYPRWARSAPVALLRILAYYCLSWPATVIMACPSIRGRENLSGLRWPLLFVSNHITKVDLGFILAALPFRFRHRLAVAMLGEMLEEMRRPAPEMSFAGRWTKKLSYRLLVALFNVFPLPQKSGFRESFDFAGESVDLGCSILVFPEGKRTQDGNMNPFQTGIGILAADLHIPVVPLRIDGLFELKQARKMFSRPGTVKVTIGPAIRYDPETDASQIALDLESQVRSMGRG
jgi:long-chain acyl-CoA synthetase